MSDDNITEVLTAAMAALTFVTDPVVAERLREALIRLEAEAHFRTFPYDDFLPS